MSRLLHAHGAGQAPAIVPDTYARFVFAVEAEEALADLDAIAADMMRAPTRRRLTRTAVRKRLTKARVALAWLLAAAAPTTRQPEATADRFEPWAE